VLLNPATYPSKQNIQLTISAFAGSNLLAPKRLFSQSGQQSNTASRDTDLDEGTTIFESYRGRATAIIRKKYTSDHAPPPTNFHHFLSSVV
jgi:hypothetical protein